MYAETCPHYLTLTDDRYAPPDEGEVIKSVISPPLRSDADRQALWMGLAGGGLDLVATDHVPDRLSVEKRVPAPPFPQISNGAPGIETLLAVVYAEGVARGRITIEQLVDRVATTPARLFGMPIEGGDRGRSGCGPRPVRSGRGPRDPPGATCTTPAISRHTRGWRCLDRSARCSSGERP